MLDCCYGVHMVAVIHCSTVDKYNQYIHFNYVVCNSGVLISTQLQHVNDLQCRKDDRSEGG